MCKNEMQELKEWLLSEKYSSVDENSTTMTEEYEHKYKYELATNIMINKVLAKLKSMEESDCVYQMDLKMLEKDRDRFYDMYHDLFKETRDYKMKAQSRVDRLLEEHKFLMTLCLRYESDNAELKRKIDSLQ